MPLKSVHISYNADHQLTAMPHTSPCPAGELRCLDGRCIILQQLCDGKEDCSDGADEVNCSISGWLHDVIPLLISAIKSNLLEKLIQRTLKLYLVISLLYTWKVWDRNFLKLLKSGDRLGQGERICIRSKRMSMYLWRYVHSSYTSISF